MPRTPARRVGRAVAAPRHPALAGAEGDVPHQAAVIGQVKDTGPARRGGLLRSGGSGAARTVGRHPHRGLADHRPPHEAAPDAGPPVPFRVRLGRPAEHARPHGAPRVGTVQAGPTSKEAAARRATVAGVDAVGVRPVDPLGRAGAGRPAVGMATGAVVGAPREGGAPLLAPRERVSPRVAVRTGQLGPHPRAVAGEARTRTGPKIPPGVRKMAPTEARVARRFFCPRRTQYRHRQRPHPLGKILPLFRVFFRVLD